MKRLIQILIPALTVVAAMFTSCTPSDSELLIGQWEVQSMLTNRDTLVQHQVLIDGEYRTQWADSTIASEYRPADHGEHLRWEFSDRGLFVETLTLDSLEYETNSFHYLLIEGKIYNEDTPFATLITLTSKELKAMQRSSGESRLWSLKRL